MKNTFFLILFSLLITACGGSSDSDSDSNRGGGTNEREERPDGSPMGEVTDEQKRLVVGSMLAGLNLAIPLPNGFVAHKCKTVKDFYDEFGEADCANTCVNENTFQRNCSGESQKAFCGSEVLNIAYEEHLLSWDMSRLDEDFQGESTFTINAEGEVASSEVAKTAFDCQLRHDTEDASSMDDLSCNEDFDITCDINGTAVGCEELLEAANQMRECVGNLD